MKHRKKMKKTVLFLYIIIYMAVLPVGADNMLENGRRWHTSDVAMDDTATWTGRMQRRLDSLVNLPLFERTQLGIYVRDLTTGRDLFRIGHRQRMRPASNQKVVTAVAALHHLGGGHQLSTRMLLTGEVRDSVLWGDVWVVGGMDPLLSQGEVRRMAQSLREAGIDSLAGKICLDLSFKDRDDWGWGWCWDDDMTPLRPLMVEKKDCFAETLLSGLSEAGVKGGADNRLEKGTCPDGARIFCEVTHTLDQALVRMMKRSDNYYAESVFYQLGAMDGHRNANRKDAAARVDQMISRVGLSPARYQTADGSGVSLYNYVSPELLVRLLEYAWTREPIRQSLLPTLPIAGVDGTLKDRMKGTAAEGNVRAKTGTVNGVSSLSGYATSPEGHTLVFSIINQGIPTSQTGRDWQDRVCEAMCKQ